MHILIIADEAELIKNIQAWLKTSDYHCETVANAAAAIQKIALLDYDCTLVDISMAGGDGSAFVEHLKKNTQPAGVILMSPKHNTGHWLRAESPGDYNLPIYFSGLLAAIESVTRRPRLSGNHVLVLEEMTIDTVGRLVLINNSPVELTKSKYELLLYLAINKNRIISRYAIAAYLSGDSPGNSSNLDFIYAHMKNLKRKLSAAGCASYIRSVYGRGYTLRVNDRAPK